MKHVRYRFSQISLGGFRDWGTLIFGDDCPHLGRGVPLFATDYGLGGPAFKGRGPTDNSDSNRKDDR